MKTTRIIYGIFFTSDDVDLKGRRPMDIMYICMVSFFPDMPIPTSSTIASKLRENGITEIEIYLANKYELAARKYN